MNIFPIINNLLIIFIVSTGIWLSFWVYANNYKSKTHRFFLLMIFLALLWIVLCYLGSVFVVDLSLSIFLARIAYGTTVLFFIPFYFFSINFLGEEQKYRYLKISVLFGSIILFFISAFTDLVAKDMVLTDFGLVPILGEGKFLYFGFVLLVSLFILSRFLKKYFKANDKEKLKLQYFLIGFLIFVIANLIFNVVLAIQEGIARYYLIGNYSIVFFLAFTAYAIVKQHLFGMKIVLTSLMVAFITITLLIDIFVLTPEIILKLFKSLLLAFFIYFGWVLIKSVFKETEEKKKLKRLAKKLRAANSKLTAAYIQLKKLDDTKSEFISIVSHQLRTPLTVIKGYLSMIMEGFYGQMPENTKKPLNSVYISSERLIKLVNDFLNFSRLESGKTNLLLEKLPLEDLILSVVTELKLEAEEKKLKLLWKAPEKPLPLIMADREKMRQVFINLVDNAIKYTNKGFIAITVKYNDYGNKILIEFKDTGEGITPEEVSKVFKSFSRGMAGKKFYAGGCGLGLYICEKFVKMHKGKIWVESEGKGKGSSFYVELPVRENVSAQPDSKITAEKNKV